MNEDIIKNIEQTKEKLKILFDSFSAEDFRRVHGKFFHSLVALEVQFERLYPKEWEQYQKDLYGE